MIMITKNIKKRKGEKNKKNELSYNMEVENDTSKRNYKIKQIDNTMKYYVYL